MTSSPGSPALMKSRSLQVTRKEFAAALDPQQNKKRGGGSHCSSQSQKEIGCGLVASAPRRRILEKKVERNSAASDPIEDCSDLEVVSDTFFNAEHMQEAAAFFQTMTGESWDALQPGVVYAGRPVLEWPLLTPPNGLCVYYSLVAGVLTQN